MADVSDADLIDFAKNLDWHAWVDESEEIRESLDAIRNRVNEMEDGAGLEDAERVKLVIVGDSAVGKTSMLISYCTNKFPDDYVPTVFENYTAQMDLDGTPILLQLWDTAGQEDYDRLRPLSYPGADVVLVCFCLVSSATSEAVQEKWSPEVEHYASGVPQVLVGTKVDLRNASEADPHAESYEPISKAEGEALAKDIGAVKYCEVSAKTREGLEDVFKECVRCVLERRGIKPGAAAAKPDSPKKKAEPKKEEPAPSKPKPVKKEASKKKDKTSKGGKKKDDKKKKNCKNQ